MDGVFKGWIPQKSFGFVRTFDGEGDVFLHSSKVSRWWELQGGAQLSFDVEVTHRGRAAINVSVLSYEPSTTHRGTRPTVIPFTGDPEAIHDEEIESEEIEELDPKVVQRNLLSEIATWKREAKAEDSRRYFYHVKEVDQIQQGSKYFVIGRKGSGKTAISEHFANLHSHDVFAERLSFKNFPFNQLYGHKDASYAQPNQFITIWKYLIYNTICRLLLRNEAIDPALRNELSSIYSDSLSLSRRVNKWVGKEFGISLFGLSFKFSTPAPQKESEDWVERVNYLEDLLLGCKSSARYFVLFDELDEDYRDIVAEEKYDQYTSLITSLFKAVQDVRTTFSRSEDLRVLPVIFLRDDIFDIVDDSDKNKWGDYRVDLNWDVDKIKRLIAFRISRAIDPECEQSLSFSDAWSRVFGGRPIGVGSGKYKKISTFEFIQRSTFLRPRDFVAYLQNCAAHASDAQSNITPDVVRSVDKAFSNYLRQEITDELFPVLPDIRNIFDIVSQLRKWNFSIREFERMYSQQVEQQFIQEKNVKFVLQVLFLFSVIGNSPRVGRYVFRYFNPEARLNFNERVVVHRGLFKALQIL